MVGFCCVVQLHVSILVFCFQLFGCHLTDSLVTAKDYPAVVPMNLSVNIEFVFEHCGRRIFLKLI